MKTREAAVSGTVQCRHVVELLPWFLNGSLELEERRQVEEHLSLCGACQRELQASRSVWDMLDQHVPSLDLARHAEGDLDTDLEPETIELHLEICARCRREHDLASGVHVGEERNLFPFRRQPDSKRRIPLAVAAGIAAASVAGGILWTTTSLSMSEEREKVEMASITRDAELQQESSELTPPMGGAQILLEDFESGRLTGWSEVSNN